LKRAIEAKHPSKSWYAAILSSINKKKQFGFSEFETYANFVYSKNPRRYVLKSAKNKSLATDITRLSKAKLKAFSKKYRSLSFHKRKGYVRK
jgi:hypothetical protein